VSRHSITLGARGGLSSLAVMTSCLLSGARRGSKVMQQEESSWVC